MSLPSRLWPTDLQIGLLKNIRMNGTGSATFSETPAFLTFALQILLTSAIVGLTRPSSWLRVASLPIIICCAVAEFSTLGDHFRSQWASAMCGTGLLLLFQHIDLVFLAHRPSKKGDVHRSSSSSQSRRSREARGFVRNLARGFNETTSFRHIDTTEEVKGVPLFSRENPDYVPPRSWFLLRSFLTVAFCYLVLDITDTLAPDARQTAQMFSTDLIPLITKPQNLSTERLMFRLSTSLAFFFTLLCVAHLTYQSFALCAVGLGIHGPRPWRPLFNSLSVASSIRLFWGYVSHITHNATPSPYPLICSP